MVTDDDREVLNAAYGTAWATSLVMVGLTERLMQRGALRLEEVIFVTEEALRQMEEMRGAMRPAGQAALDSGRRLLTSRLQTLIARAKAARSGGAE